jgi:ubiquinol-cytochrome c reductase cytochrome b subunit
MITLKEMVRMKKIILGVLTLIGSLVLAFVIFSGGGNPDSQAEAYGPQATEQSEVADTMADMPGMAPASEDHADDTHDEADTMADMPGMSESGDHADEEADHEHAGEEGGHGHSHGAPRVGYIGMEAENETTLDETELDSFVDRVQEEAYKKADVDQIRFVIFGGFFVLAYLSFAKIKVWDLSNRLRNAIDWHTVGTVSGMILIFLVIPSGIIITFVYMPTSTGVYASVEKMADQPVLAFFRNLHNWSSEIFVFLSLLHAARTVSTKTFLGKRKLIWLLGALAFVAGWVAFLSGTFMRGDQEALEGFEHMMYSFSLVPLGNYISDFFSGEFTIMKLTALHIGVTMFIIALTLTLHVLMRKVHVLVTRRWKKALVYTLALTAFLVVQSIWMEAPFVRGTAAGPTISGIEATKPPWPIYFLIQGENWFGANAMVTIMLVAFVPLIIFPYVVEFLPLSPAKKARVGEALFYAGVFAMIVVSYIAAAGQIKAHIFM